MELYGSAQGVVFFLGPFNARKFLGERWSIRFDGRVRFRTIVTRNVATAVTMVAVVVTAAMVVG